MLLSALSQLEDRSRSGRRRPLVSGCPGSERQQTSFLRRVHVLGWVKTGFMWGRLRTGNPCRCKLLLTGTGPVAAGVSVSMFESRWHLSHLSMKKLLYMSDIKRNRSMNFAMRRVIELNGHNVEFVFFSWLWKAPEKTSNLEIAFKFFYLTPLKLFVLISIPVLLISPDNVAFSSALLE